MGRKLDAVKNKSKEGSDSFKKTNELGKKAVSDTKQMKQLLDSLPTDVDDEITEAARAVTEGTKADATNYMNTEVNTNLESGRKHMETSSKDAAEQIKNNEQTKRTFERMDSVGSFGKNARMEGNSKLDSSTNDFQKVAEDNETRVKEAEDAFKNDLSEISSTF